MKSSGSRLPRNDVAIGVEQPTRGRAGHPWSPYLALLQVGFSRRYVTAVDRTLLPSDFTLVRQRRTVCFCATFRLPRGPFGHRRSLGVTQHPARRSPDFPPPRLVGAAVTRYTWPSLTRTVAYPYRGVKLVW